MKFTTAMRKLFDENNTAVQVGRWNKKKVKVLVSLVERCESIKNPYMKIRIYKKLRNKDLDANDWRVTLRNYAIGEKS